VVNHPNRSKRWTRDGDLHVMTGTLGRYEITEWVLRNGSNFVVVIDKSFGKGDGFNHKTVGEYSSLDDAKLAAVARDQRKCRRTDLRRPLFGQLAAR